MDISTFKKPFILMGMAYPQPFVRKNYISNAPFHPIEKNSINFWIFFFKLKNPSIFNFNICIRIKGYFFDLGYVIEDSINKNHTFYSDIQKVAACDSSLWIILNLLLHFHKKKHNFYTNDKG